MNTFFRKTCALGALAASLALISGAASASTLVDQSFDAASPVRGANFSEGTQRVYDDFSLDAAATATSLTIWGVHWTSGVVPEVLDFKVDIFADTGAELGALVGSSALSIVSSTDTGVDHNNVSGANILEYVFNLESAIDLAAGEYWLTSYLMTDDPGTTFAWQRISTSDRSIRLAGGTPSTFGNMAWVLDSGETPPPPVPLPASLPLALAGCAALFGLSRRKRTA